MFFEWKWKLIEFLYIVKVVSWLFVFIFETDAQNFRCPDKDGQYEDPVQCDKYYECVDGEPTTKLCPDGLVFDPTIRKINKCDQPFNVDCGDRLELREF